MFNEKNEYHITKNTLIRAIDGGYNYEWKNIKSVLTGKEDKEDVNAFLINEGYKNHDESKMDEYMYNLWKYVFFEKIKHPSNILSLIKELYGDDLQLND